MNPFTIADLVCYSSSAATLTEFSNPEQMLRAAEKAGYGTLTVWNSSGIDMSMPEYHVWKQKSDHVDYLFKNGHAWYVSFTIDYANIPASATFDPNLDILWSRYKGQETVSRCAVTRCPIVTKRFEEFVTFWATPRKDEHGQDMLYIVDEDAVSEVIDDLDEDADYGQQEYEVGVDYRGYTKRPWVREFNNACPSDVRKTFDGIMKTQHYEQIPGDPISYARSIQMIDPDIPSGYMDVQIIATITSVRRNEPVDLSTYVPTI